MVVEVMLHALDDLIVLVSLAGYEDDVARLSHCASGADGFSAIYYADDAAPLRCVETSQHVVDDVLRLLVPGVVTRDDDAVAVLDGFLSHQGALALIAVAACAANRPALSFARQHFVDCREDVDEGIGCVGVIDDSRDAFLRADGLEATIDGPVAARRPA